MNIDTWFPTSILWARLDPEKYDLEAMVKRAYEIRENCKDVKTNWLCDTYNSIETHDFFQDETLMPLLHGLFPIVEEFAKHFGVVPEKIHCPSAWVNIAPPGEYQEFHIHDHSHFSAVVYLKTAPNCGNIVFKSLSHALDMFRLPTKQDGGTCSYPPENLKVLVFRSNLLHMVEKNKSQEDRISVSFNFMV